MNRQVLGLLRELEKRDQKTRSRLLKGGRLFQGYAPEMETVHVENAKALESLLDWYGWPGRALVGDEGAEAAWLIAQHAISRPAFQRRCLELIRKAVQRGDAPARHEAALIDRLRFNERKPQVFGTICDWDAQGELSPWPIEAPKSVNQRRARVGLPPLAQTVKRLRNEAAAEGNTPPISYQQRQEEIDAWARRVGWLPAE